MRHYRKSFPGKGKSQEQQEGKETWSIASKGGRDRRKAKEVSRGQNTQGFGNQDEGFVLNVMGNVK